jgi:hypothetical protein
VSEAFPARRIAAWASDAHAVARRDLPAHELLANLLARAATEALLIARAEEARRARTRPKAVLSWACGEVLELRPNRVAIGSRQTRSALG